MTYPMRTFLHRFLAVLVLVTVLAPAAVAQTPPPAPGTEPMLVFEALRVLQTNYVDPVDVARVLNAATEALRAQLSSAGIALTLPEIPPGTPEADARRLFADRFAAALTSAGTALTVAQLSYAAIRGMTEAFKDSHTGFLTPQQNQERRQRQRGQAGFTGVGIILLPKDGKFFVWSTIPGGPAEAAGVHDFDRILKVNGMSTEGMQVDQVSGLIRGTAGTPVTLTLQRPGAPDPLQITVTRSPIVVPSIFKTDFSDDGIGYIKLYQFVEGTARDFRSALTRLLDRRMRALILDLRGNSGGYINELNGVMNTLLPSGVPVYTEMRPGGVTRVQRTSGPTLLPSGMPLVVLVDEGSASAAELLSAAIKENGRGQLVGAKTAGAVEASLLIDLSDGSGLSVTTFRLATGKGVRLEGIGIEPDTTVTVAAGDLESGTDRALGAAMRLARQILVLPTR